MDTRLKCTIITVHPNPDNFASDKVTYTWACKEHNIRSGLILMSAEAAYNDAIMKHREQI